ncbi:MAG: AarF/ABC1/UbiB kinase family protein [Desulfobacter sp.]|nr:MAG: AarF/ABC1/UbiB kinase family protein [Desulfobacter sp.]
MNSDIPRGKLSRTLSSGRIAAKMGKNQVKYWLKKPFLNGTDTDRAKQDLAADNARTLFDGLAMLRGTALKAAQMLSLETEFFPKEFQKELEKSYHQVPPINRALARKIIQNNFGRPPEALFDSFDSTAFAAASLGQVHSARAAGEGSALAVKIQYPGIRDTISNDIRMLKTLVYPMTEYEILKTALDEIETVLVRETDYTQEAEHLEFFRQHLDIPGVRIPKVYPSLSTDQVLTMSRLQGRVLSDWLETGPDRESKTRVGQTLNNIFVKGFYELNLIHADPNPGNFLITDDLAIGLLDFGCVRAFEPRFIRLYKKLVRMAGHKDLETFRSLLMELNFISPDLDRAIQDEMAGLFRDMAGWYGRLFMEETFDFGAHPDFMEKGKKLGLRMHHFSKHIHRINPEFIFLDRTRYGLIRLFEKMGVCLKMQNPHEFCA